ncbi:hypothetical protein GCM10007301_52770 [Azorhizobium oxalatiphilum]|uniref:Uncharacterized protein n=1 Tax=Azorhizobium oxalatiphilum TaxID=980631 RepID=A0A917FI16_9HYPH|nr:hypothetical protein [Azorhizobium oxalatiphilum]GGF86332.1 hypothetical protein GCM10007301_52770 [Azorhizobium oxalatiphilum]
MSDKKKGALASDNALGSDPAAHPPEAPRTYADGHPLDEIHYIEAKIILHGSRFTSVKNFFDFAKIVRKVAKDTGVDFDETEAEGLRPQIREVLFLDTKDFKLYNNAFILRRRINYEDGFPVGEPEMVFKFRHPDLETATLLDVRPNISGPYRIKFKEELLPLKDRLGGSRQLFSHNVEFKYHPTDMWEDPSSATSLCKTYPALAQVLSGSKEHVGLVNRTAVEEVLQQLGTLDFGKGVMAASNVSVWRTRGDQHQLVGEFSYQMRMERRADVSARAIERSSAFFVALQHAAQDWVSLGTTKTGAVYRLKGAPPQSHE